MTLATFIQASAHQLDGIADGSVQAIVTSPPYFGLRAYAGEQGVEWPAVEYASMPGLPTLTVPAMRSPLGNEPTGEAYIGHLILCLREWRRVLRDDGICFVNLSSSYCSKTTEPDLYYLRDDLTPEETRYVLAELATIQNAPAIGHD